MSEHLVLVSHGRFARNEKSAEMIIGPQKQFQLLLYYQKKVKLTF